MVGNPVLIKEEISPMVTTRSEDVREVPNFTKLLCPIMVMEVPVFGKHAVIIYMQKMIPFLLLTGYGRKEAILNLCKLCIFPLLPFPLVVYVV